MPIIISGVMIWLSIILLLLIFAPGVYIWTKTPYDAWFWLIALCGLYEILMRLADVRQIKENSLSNQNEIPISVLVFRRIGKIFIMPCAIYFWITGVLYLLTSSVLINTYGWIWITVAIILFALYILKDFLKPWFKSF
jgi:hypothetical protein